MTSKVFTRTRWLGLLLLIVCVTCTRALYVSLYSADIPFWDQWDLLNRTLAPWWSGTHWPPLFEPHNEHRITFTRLISMGLLALNGGVWSNLAEAYVNTLIYAGVLALYAACLSRELTSWAPRLAMLLAVLIVGCLPFGWENNLVGFQNQFYLMAASAMALVAMAAYRESSWPTLLTLSLLGGAALFTMASGLLGSLAVVAVLILRTWRSPSQPAVTWVSMAVLAGVAAIGLFLTPVIAGHAVLKAQGMYEHVHALFAFLIWPLQPLTGKRGVFALVIWWPLLVWVVRFLRTRKASDGELFAVGMLVWVLLQAVAFAHARGHGASELSSRYSDIPAIGILANFALALLGLQHLDKPSWRRITICVIAFSALATGAVFTRRLPLDIAAMHQRHQFLLIETYYTQAYLRDHQPGDLNHPGLSIPYINGEALGRILDKQEVVRLLPPILRAGPEDSTIQTPRGSWLTLGSAALQRELQQAFGHIDGIPLFQPTAQVSLGEQASFQGQCYIDTVNADAGGDVVVVRNGDVLQLDGWIVDRSMATSPDFDTLLMGQATFASIAHSSGTRRDVVKVLHSPPQNTREYSMMSILKDVPPGDYALAFASRGQDRRVMCRPKQTVRIEQ